MWEAIKKLGVWFHDISMKDSDGSSSHTKFFSFVSQLLICGAFVYSIFTGAHVQVPILLVVAGLTCNRSVQNVISTVWGKAPPEDK